MSVLVKAEDGRMINYIKGADVALIPRISKLDDEIRNKEIIRLMD
jgi:magnesium-transporting ATPase (P-type)